VLVENPFTGCLVTVAQPSALNQAEAVSCVQQQYPGYRVGTTGGNYTFQVNCPDGEGGTYCTTISNVIALSPTDAQACVQSQYGGCSVGQGACPF
jgi:hypothetical protein